MNYVLKHNETGKYVAAPGSAHSYTNDRNCAQEFTTAEQANKQRCVESEHVCFSTRDRVVPMPLEE